MALQNLTGGTFQEFVIDTFIPAVEAGGRFLTVNLPSGATITKLEDYNFYTNLEGIHGITSDGGNLVDIEDTYILPSLDLTGFTGETPLLNEGAYLMAIQHFIDAGAPIKRHLTQAAKSSVPVFVGDLRNSYINNCKFNTTEDVWTGLLGGLHTISNGKMEVQTVSNGRGVYTPLPDLVVGNSYRVFCEVVSFSGTQPLLSYYPQFTSGTGKQDFTLSLGMNEFTFTATTPANQGHNLYFGTNNLGDANIIINSVCLYDDIIITTATWEDGEGWVDSEAWKDN